jgi:hypothetical protein
MMCYGHLKKRQFQTKKNTYFDKKWNKKEKTSPMKKKTCILLFFVLISYLTGSEKILTVAERSDFSRTSLYADVMRFLFDMQKKSDKIFLSKLTTSTEGRMIPLVIISREGIQGPTELQLFPKPALLIMANIHAGEVEGKEAVLMILRDFSDSLMDNILDNQVILILPIFNPDGNEKLGPNRGDNGPELAGVRYNGQYLDLNRDFLKLESPEVRALVRLMNQWDPVLIVDLHTTDGSYHREPVTYSTQTNPNTCELLRNYMWDNLFPAVSATLKKKYNTDSVPYGNFVDRFNPGKGWENDAIDARFGFNYVGLRNRFAILNENYSHADFKTRVMGCYYFLKSILQFTSRNILQMKQITREADIRTRNQYRLSGFVLEYKIEKLSDLKLKSYKFVKEKIKPEDKDQYPPWYGDYLAKKTDILVDYKIPYLSKAVPARSMPLPAGYVILPNHESIVKKIREHGIIIQKFRTEFKTKAEEIVLDEITPEKQIYQGHIRLNCRVHTLAGEKKLPEGAYFVSMRQPLARLIPVLLEPESTDSLLSWGYFNREIVSQWSGKPLSYPVYRIPDITDFPELYQPF